MRGTVMNVVERLPASATPHQVVRAVRRAMREEFKRNTKARTARKSAYRLALEHHDYWRRLTGASR